MKVAVVGRGNIGGGLADLWEKAVHEVTRIGREGGDVSDAEVVLVAVPGGAIAVTNSSERAQAQQIAFIDAAQQSGVAHVVSLIAYNARSNDEHREPSLKSVRCGFESHRPYSVDRNN